MDSEKIKNILAQADAKLNIVEVKGDSVQSLFSARLLLKEAFSLLDEEESKEGTDGKEDK